MNNIRDREENQVEQKHFYWHGLDNAVYAAREAAMIHELYVYKDVQKNDEC